MPFLNYEAIPYKGKLPLKASKNPGKNGGQASFSFLQIKTLRQERLSNVQGALWLSCTSGLLTPGRCFSPHVVPCRAKCGPMVVLLSLWLGISSLYVPFLLSPPNILRHTGKHIHSVAHTLQGKGQATRHKDPLCRERRRG